MENNEKINGYTREEAEELVDFIAAGKKEGKALSYLFALYGKSHGRAKGSVRNYYYGLLKSPDERVVRMLDGKDLTVGEIKAFSQEETDEVLRRILLERAKGLSVRRAIFNLSGGDEKLTLRLQNKYRNLKKKEPLKVERIEKELGIENAPPRGESPIKKRLEDEIDGLIRRLLSHLEEENARLKAEIARLKGEE